ncbi:hypothetical protein [Gallintestinimicrobium sp.]|uniref:hypothetical protein n=1 Tax=Gallintestinimicrobium sp. TaxID=2981655 RepID=UPI0039969629
MLSGKLYGNTTLKGQAWNTLTVDLSKLKGTADFDYSQIKSIKFNYSYPRDIYLDDFVFRSGVQVTQHIGFKVNQEDIPDYDSVASGNLKKPKGAVYSLSNSYSTDTGVIREDGTFVLADGQTATFRNQFRRGSYISVKEEIDSPAFETSWSLYENGHAVGKVTNGWIHGNDYIRATGFQRTRKADQGWQTRGIYGGRNSKQRICFDAFCERREMEILEDAIVFRSYSIIRMMKTMLQN